MHSNHLTGLQQSFRPGVQQQISTWTRPLTVSLSALMALSLVWAPLNEGPYLSDTLSRWEVWLGVALALGSFSCRIADHLFLYLDGSAGNAVTSAGQSVGTVGSVRRNLIQRNSLVDAAPHRRHWPPSHRFRADHDTPQHVDRRLVPLLAIEPPTELGGRLVSPSALHVVAKRSLDLALAIVLAVVVIPLSPLIGLAIKLDSPGPVFYSQVRVGYRGHLFRIHKFRSMSTEAERHGAVWAKESDPRVTRVGRFMRRARIDELPQLWNVIRGDMTLVGPRPERPEFTCMLEAELPAYRYRQAVKPGLTGWAQVHCLYAGTVQDSSVKLDYDLYYVRYRSLLLDLKILFLTIPVILHLRGY